MGVNSLVEKIAKERERDREREREEFKFKISSGRQNA